MESKYETSEKYVYANIRIPILVNSEDELEPLVDYLTLDFEPCDSLPEKPKQGVDYSVILEKLRELLQPSSDIQEELDELQAEDVVGNEDDHEEPTSNEAECEPKENMVEVESIEPEAEGKTEETTLEGKTEGDKPEGKTEETTLEGKTEEDKPDETTEETMAPLPILIRPDELKRTKHRKSLKHNYSAKSRSTSKKMKNLTMRSRKEIADTIVTALDRVFGSSPPQEAQEQAQEGGQ